MPAIASIDYACYARWTYSAVNYAVGTDEGYRSSQNHDPVMTTDMRLASLFQRGVVRGNSLSLTIADGSTGTYRALVSGSVLDGTQVTVETVAKVHFDDGTITEQATTQILTVSGSRIEPGKVTLTLVDIEDARLETLYPSNTYTADLFRDIDGGFAGRAIPYPIGTCRKFTCPQLFADSVRAQWFHAVCDASGYLTLTIAAINTGAKTFSVAGDYTDRISAGTIVYSNAASANPGRYTVTGAVYSAPNTVITVSETISSGTVSGALIVPPTVLAVYRDGRLVASSEYTVELAWPLSGQIDDSDFDGSPASWNAVNAGTGTAALTGGVARFTGDGGAVNYGTLVQNTATPTTLPRSFGLFTFTIAAGSVIRAVGGTGIAAGTVASGAGAHTVPVQQTLTTGVARCNFNNVSTGSAATTDIDNLSANTTHTLLLIKFAREQVGFDGRPYTITADVRGTVSRNVADEISRLLIAAGATPDASSFATAQTYATTHGMLVDVDHGRGDDRDGGQRTLLALLDDLLFIARATLSRSSAGAYVITQDKTGTSAATLDEDAGDLIEVSSLDQPPKPQSISLRFAPNPRDPANLTYTITRAASGGTLPAESPTEVRYLSDATAADRLGCYLALREQYNARLSFRQIGAQRTLGEVVTIASASLYSGNRDWFVDDVQQIPGGVQCQARQYNAAVHTYSAGTLPNGATTAYQPDYSQTPPLAPSGMRIIAGTGTGIATANDGTMTSRLQAAATAPTVNWAEIWFACIHNVTGEVSTLVRGTLSGTEYVATLGGLRPGEVYQLQGYAINAFAVQGAVQNTFNATALGGGATDTTFTSPGQTTVPGNVSSITATQRMGRIIEVTWPAVTAAALWGYVLEQEIGGSGTWVEVQRGQTTSYRATNVSIGTAYKFRVKARDTYGNVSANWATSGTVTPSGNVTGGGGGDLGTDTVETSNRTATNTFSIAYTNPGALQTGSYTITHSLGKMPLLTVDTAGKTSVIAVLHNVTTTTAIALVMGTGIGITDDVAPTNPHHHTVLGWTEAGTVYVRVW